MTRVLALDLATTSGFAVDAPGGKALFGTFRVRSGGGDELGPQFSSFRLWLADMIKVHAPDLLVFEAPLVASKLVTTQHTVRLLFGLAAHAEEIGYSARLKVFEANVQTIKKFHTGTGRADKGAMVKMCRLYGYDVRDHNSADALALWMFTKNDLGEDNPAKHGPMYAGART